MDGEKRTSLGLEENVEAALAYVGIFITGIIFLALEKESEFVRFHAMQSTVAFLGLFFLWAIFSMIPFMGWIIALLVQIVGLVVWIVGIVKAYQGERYKFPIVGDIAEQWLPKVNF
ncbi:DUF4870 domain-containing protein [Pyrococcus yayanosii]|uniref:DUF4870 domain-containing protein n=1 Tax=Pyrococcus yayanosii (strain CH1 / JCM 16557) TaxID=529709 RepID=F8AEY3_PYRYC|nr:DUF4870 domain-containing protein [Pyrococcus yayanosii]AEH24820.1 hypothetical protein PYCH_11390 [Pyrococcus yayanosii CH1]